MLKSVVILFGLLSQSAWAAPRAPYLATFQKDSKTLAYIAADHHSSVQYPDAKTDPTFKTIGKVVADTKPQAIVVEGVSPSDIAGFIQFARRCDQANYNLPGQYCDESSYAGFLAITSQAALLTGEPSGRDVLAAFLAAGYAEQDVLAFYLMRMIPEIKRHETVTHQNFPAMAERLLKDDQRELGTTVTFAFADFVAWYAAKMPAPKDYLDLTTNDTGPSTAPDATLLQNLSATCNTSRDANVVGVIKMLLDRYDRVMVVYGASHLGYEEQGLDEFLGAPQITKPFQTGRL